MLNYVLLGLLFDKEATGYDIKKEAEGGIGNFYKISYGRMYPTLKTMTENGHLLTREEMQGKRQKIYYKATKEGKGAFIEWLSTPVLMTMAAEEQLSRIFFYGKLPEDVRDKRLMECEILSNQGIQITKEIEKHILKQDASKRDYFAESTLYYAMQMNYTTARWLAHIREEKPLSQFVIKNNEED
ncbi:MAG: PadR family transcriptional regulator [Defluviitaleaceae bacterium]|nr:PadR family transcriptional regulator [Defluviitaleaceae bacterium]